MFASTRAINGVIAFMSLLLSYFLIVGVNVSTTTHRVIAMCILVIIFFICDCVLRKKGERNDVWFAIAWTLFHAFTLYIGIARFSTLSRELNLFHSMIVATFSGLPLVANLTYLAIFREQLKEGL